MKEDSTALWTGGALGFALGLITGAFIFSVVIQQHYHENIPAAISLVLDGFIALGTIGAAAYAAIGFNILQQEKKSRIGLLVKSNSKHTSFELTAYNQSFHPALITNCSLKISHPQLKEFKKISIDDNESLPMRFSAETPPFKTILRPSLIIHIINKNKLQEAITNEEILEDIKIEIHIKTHDTDHKFDLLDISPSFKKALQAEPYKDYDNNDNQNSDN